MARDWPSCLFSLPLDLVREASVAVTFLRVRPVKKTTTPAQLLSRRTMSPRPSLARVIGSRPSPVSPPLCSPGSRLRLCWPSLPAARPPPGRLGSLLLTWALRSWRQCRRQLSVLSHAPQPVFDSFVGLDDGRTCFAVPPPVLVILYSAIGPDTSRASFAV